MSGWKDIARLHFVTEIAEPETAEQLRHKPPCGARWKQNFTPESFAETNLGLLEAAEEEREKKVYDESLNVLLHKAAFMVRHESTVLSAAVLMAASILRDISVNGHKVRKRSTKERLRRQSRVRLGGESIKELAKETGKTTHTIRGDKYRRKKGASPK